MSPVPWPLKSARLTEPSYGESHCRSVGCIVDGCPPGMALTEADIQPQMDRRRPGQSAITTPRNEKDRVVIQSGTEFGVTLGTPIGMIVANEDQRPRDYGGSTMDLYPRPSHADFTYLEKYGVKASSGGGRSSARETIGRVAAGAIAEKFLRLAYGVEIVAFVSAVGDVKLPKPKYGVRQSDSEKNTYEKLIDTVTREEVDKYLPVRCPDAEKAKEMEALILRCKEKSDSIGGKVTCVIRNLPTGLGEPAFDKLEAMLAHAMLSIPATKGFDIGSGFAGTRVHGSKHNDPFVPNPAAASTLSADAASPPSFRPAPPRLVTVTNNSGGIQGGISNGEDIVCRVSFKPVSTIARAQGTVDRDGNAVTLEAKGRHDPCVVPRAVPIVEAMACLVLTDHLLRQRTARL